jgi:hypothetical protein
MGYRMSDFLQDQTDYLPEPDESILMAALRNKDDIPILMDIVGEQLPSRVSQEMHLSRTLKSQVEPHDIDTQVQVPPVTKPIDEAALKIAIESAFAALLPDIVAKVAQILQETEFKDS